MSTATQYSVPNLERSFRILELLGQTNEGLTLTELTQLTRYPQNSIFRICRTLEELGYLKRNESTKKHQLTPRILNLALGAITPGKNISQVAAPYLQKIAKETGETTGFGTIVDTRGVILQVEDGTQSFRFHLDLGMSYPLHTSAPGKAMLAAMEPEERSAIAQKLDYQVFNENTIQTPEALLSHLKAVPNLEYWVDDEEEILGQRCIGAAIRTPKKSPNCALWITAPSSRLPLDELPRIGRLIRQACHDIEEQLEFA